MITSFGVVIVLLLCSGCGGRKKNFEDAIVERDSLPTMVTLGVTNLISDSGVTRYRILTEEWEIYDKKKPPYWAFEKGVYLEKFDSVFDIEASIKADTAYYYMDDKIWKLVRNVEIENVKGERFETDLLFWNQVTEKVYSDEFIRIDQPDRIITGYGFESNQQMTNYRILNVQGIFYVEDEAMAVRNDSLAVDTTSQPTVNPSVDVSSSRSLQAAEPLEITDSLSAQ